jgi:hypothetical protein
VLESLQQGSVGNFEGFKFSASSKQQLMEALALSISSRMIGYPEGIITQELNEFEYHYTKTGVQYSAPQGQHDDAVCALALANMLRSRPQAAQPTIRSL